MRLPPTGNEIGANSKPSQTFLDIYIYYIYMQAEIQLRLISLVLVRFTGGKGWKPAQRDNPLVREAERGSRRLYLGAMVTMLPLEWNLLK